MCEPFPSDRTDVIEKRMNPREEALCKSDRLDSAFCNAGCWGKGYFEPFSGALRRYFGAKQISARPLMQAMTAKPF